MTKIAIVTIYGNDNFGNKLQNLALQVCKYNHILDKVSKVAPELKFEALRGLTQEQLIEKYETSKLYIDFGAFSGAERIPEEYKFGKPKKINEIVEKIRYVLKNYEKVNSDFDEYRNTVLNLEENFIRSLK